jgi:hypothetical protein
MTKLYPSPIVPEDVAPQRRSSPIARAAVAYLKNALDNRGKGPEGVAARLWPTDKKTEMVVRAASSVADTTTSGWASQLYGSTVQGFLESLAPTSAGARLLQQGLQLQFGEGAIYVPSLTAASTFASFVLQAEAIPVRQALFDSVLLEPKKIATISVFSRELFMHSLPTVEGVVGDALTESVGLHLDSILLGTAAGSTTQPAGIRNSVAAISASATTPFSEALHEDVAAVVAAVSSVSRNGPIILIGAPAQAAKLKLVLGANSPFEILSSAALADSVLMGVAANGIVSAQDPSIRFEVKTEGTLHLSDAPVQIGVSATPNVIAAPVRDLYQTDSVGLRVILEISWARRQLPLLGQPLLCGNAHERWCCLQGRKSAVGPCGSPA